ncbi:hypothetical protein [Haloglomus litoreum]|uniref:hypothetical protein n=1 Tax=Haloglomus litoreum TaxID=3034026 RepID=UPI0023E8BD15|nr:hypothetical protein [Haloglomus sp. DT116]
MNRRQVLATGAAGVGALSTGCLSLAGRAVDRVDEATDRERLCVVTATNDHDEPHVAAVVVERNGTEVQRTTLELPPHDPDASPYSPPERVVDRTWSTEPANMALRGRVDGGEWRAFGFPGEAAGDCWGPTLAIDESGAWGWRFHRTVGPGAGPTPADRG